MGMKKESKKAKKKSKKEEDVDEDLADAPDFDVDGNSNNSSNDEEEESTKKSKKKKSKSSKKRSLEEEEDDTAASKSSGKVDRATRKAIKKEQKEALMAKIPKLDPDGIPYNKIQIRRMLRRVKHGLDPVATEEEEKEIREREKREKAEEERLLFAERNDEGDQEEDNDGDKDDEADGFKSDREEVDEEEEATAKKESAQAVPRKSHNPPSKKTKRNKPVPPDYICQAYATESIELVHCKLLKFEDSDLGAKLALKLNGSAWEDVEEPGVSAKKKKNGSSDKTKELKLKVTKFSVVEDLNCLDPEEEEDVNSLACEEAQVKSFDQLFFCRQIRGRLAEKCQKNSSSSQFKYVLYVRVSSETVRIPYYYVHTKQPKTLLL
eukprot:scaffold2761_cov137-Skeletonema_menzelii.AAC.3